MHDALVCIQSGKLLSDPNKLYKPGVFYIKVDRVGTGTTAHWVVNEVQQDVAIPIPANPNN